jgi:hypothetical protein
MSDPYQHIKDREYARLAKIHAELDRKNKIVQRRILVIGVILGLVLLYFIFFR